MLDFYQIRSGLFYISPERFNMVSAVQEIVDLMMCKAIEKESVELRFHPTVTNLIIFQDERRLK